MDHGDSGPGAGGASANNALTETSGAKVEEIKKLLDSRQAKDKMEGMKRLIAMFSKGRDVSSLFPDVVKNVVCPNMEVKKLVHIYLQHYCEEQPDLALLSVGTFQKNLTDSNQLIRAMSLRVLSSIRVPIIAQVVTLAIKQGCGDTSPYVRKTAAHAIPKVYSLCPEEKPQLQEMIGTLLNDTSTLVLGSAVAAFMEVCPEAYELIHPNYRKLCHLLVDTDEWGQVMMLNLLTRYCRTQFLDPNSKNAADDENKPFYSDDEDKEKEKKPDAPPKDDTTYYMNPDHRLLLKGAHPLLQSRNSAVVFGVAMLYFHCAPKYEAQQIGKALVRLVRDVREKQYVVLSNIASLASQRPSMFVNNLNDFMVLSTDPGYIKSLKLEILSHLATEQNITKILKELKTYVKSGETAFVTESIQAVGRCAMRVREVTESCMDGLMSLLSSRSEAVVAESVVVIKTLLQLRSESNDGVIKHLARLLDSIVISSARASIVWVIGEYCNLIPKIAPDVLRKLAKTFPAEDDLTKLQVLNLGGKLFLSNPAQTSRLFEYVLQLAKYDLNYDIRDRARLMRGVLMPDTPSVLGGDNGKTLFQTKKPIPVMASASQERSRYIVGSLSQLVNHPVEGYTPLPDFPAVEPPCPARSISSDKKATGQLGDPLFTKGGNLKDEYTRWMEDEDEYSYYSDEDAKGKREDDEYSYYSDEDAPAAARPAAAAGGASSSKAAAKKGPDIWGKKRADDDEDYSYYSDEDTPAAARKKPAHSSSSSAGPAAPVSFDPLAGAKKPAAKQNMDDLLNLFAAPASGSSGSLM